MKNTKKRARPAARYCRTGKHNGSAASAAQLLHRTFHYLNAREFLNISNRLMCEAC